MNRINSFFIVQSLLYQKMVNQLPFSSFDRIRVGLDKVLLYS